MIWHWEGLITGAGGVGISSSYLAFLDTTPAGMLGAPQSAFARVSGAIVFPLVFDWSRTALVQKFIVLPGCPVLALRLGSLGHTGLFVPALFGASSAQGEDL